VSDLLLLDYNGVIADDEPLHREAFFAVLAEEGVTLSREEYDAAYLGRDDRACFQLVLEGDGRPIVPGDVGHLVERKRARYLALAERGLPLVPGAAAFVREAARRWPVAVVSGAPRHEVALGLARAGITALVGAVVSCDDVPTSKPDPSGFRLALTTLAASAPGPWRAAIVEDSLPGLAAAHAVGAGCLMLATAHPAPALADADLVWASFEGHHPTELEPLFREVAIARRA
jgi:beta-phosphoglucomutase